MRRKKRNRILLIMVLRSASEVLRWGTNLIWTNFPIGSKLSWLLFDLASRRLNWMFDRVFRKEGFPYSHSEKIILGFAKFPGNKTKFHLFVCPKIQLIFKIYILWQLMSNDAYDIKIWHQSIWPILVSKEVSGPH